MPIPSLRDVLDIPLHDPNATRVGATLGAVVGGGFSVALHGIGNTSMLGLGSLLGAVMGAAGTEYQQFVEDRELQRHVHPHARGLVEYPAIRELLRKAGTDIGDIAALHSLAQKLENDIKRMVAIFEAFCVSRSVTPNPLIADVIRHFFLTHCADRGIALLTRASARDCYLVAAHTRDQGRIAAAMNEEGVTAGTALRRHRFPYLRVDVANERLRNARAFKADMYQGEWQVHPEDVRPGDTLETMEPSEARAVHRRSTRSHCSRAQAAAKALVPHGMTHAVPAEAPPGPVAGQVIRGPLLRAKLAELVPGSRTLRELEKIEGDLLAQRPCGHLVCYEGVHYLAIDIHWPGPKGDGRRNAGRNVWRLLVLQTPGGHELVNIVDYHRPHA